MCIRCRPCWRNTAGYPPRPQSRELDSIDVEFVSRISPATTARQSHLPTPLIFIPLFHRHARTNLSLSLSLSLPPVLLFRYRYMTAKLITLLKFVVKATIINVIRVLQPVFRIFKGCKYVSRYRKNGILVSRSSVLS